MDIAQDASVAALVAKLQNARSQAAMSLILSAERPYEPTKSLAAEIKAHIPILEGHLKAKRASEAIATALAMVFFDVDHAISCMRRDGVLRASRYGYKGALIGRVAKAALSIRHMTGASSNHLAYLQSVVALSKVSINAGTLYEEIVRTVRAYRTVVLKTVLVTVNYLFYHRWMHHPEASPLDSRHYSSEEYAEAASLILATYASLFPVDDECCNHVDLKVFGARAVVYDRLLIAAIRLTKFREAELMIDGLPYRAELDGNTVTISSIDPDIERSVRLGYIQGEFQAAIRLAYPLKVEPAISMREFVELGFQRESFQHLLELVEKPVRRLRLKLPATPEIFAFSQATNY